jgi:hypothetical protein
MWGQHGSRMLRMFQRNILPPFSEFLEGGGGTFLLSVGNNPQDGIFIITDVGTPNLLCILS